MTLALSQLYRGPLDFLTPPRIEATPGDDVIAASHLLDPAYLDALLERYGAQYGHGDRRAVASLWSKWHFAGLAAHGLATNLLLERDLPLGVDELHVVQTPEGQTAGFSLRHAGRPLAELDGLGRFATLLDGHLIPLIETLAKVSGASPKVFWSNAGSYVDYFAGAMADHPMGSPAAAEPGLALISTRHLPDGRRNPLYQAVRHVVPADPEAPTRMPKTCCIRYLLDDLGYCANCPLECRRKAKAAKAAQTAQTATVERTAP